MEKVSVMELDVVEVLTPAISSRQRGKSSQAERRQTRNMSQSQAPRPLQSSFAGTLVR
jgi:hypothetical protein